MSDEIIGKVYDIQGFSVQDGPGIRTTVFLKGCPLRCPWCHSPESQSFDKQLSWISQRCVGLEECGSQCLRPGLCHADALSAGKVVESVTGEEKQLIHIDRQLCDDCGECTKVCAAEAIYICGRDYTVDQLVERISRDLPFYRRSGGGVTISGGEPLCQIDFVEQVAKRLHEKGVSVAFDTTGFVPWTSIERVLPYTDLFLYDLKHMDSHSHKVVIGVPNELILENVRKIAASGGKLQIRIPAIPRFNDDDDNLSKTAQLCVELGDAVQEIQILPYHNHGISKYARIYDESVQVMEATPHTAEQVQHMMDLMLSFDLPVVLH